MAKSKKLDSGVVRRAQTKALLTRLTEGKPLTKAQLAELEGALEKQPRKAGRPKKPAVPGSGDDKPAAEISVATAVAAELARVKARVANGDRLANHESRVLRDAWLIDNRTHIWESTDAAAADLGVSPGTLRGYADDGCPGIEAHSAIPKAPVLSWLLKRAHERGGAAPATKASIEEVDLQIARAKAAKLWGSLTAEAEDRATQGVIQSQGALRHHLLNVAPEQLVDAVKLAPDRGAAIEAATALIDQALRNHPYQAPSTTTASATTEQKP